MDAEHPLPKPEMDMQAAQFVVSMYDKIDKRIRHHANQCELCSCDAEGNAIRLCLLIQPYIQRMLVEADYTCMDVFLSGAPMAIEVIYCVKTRGDWANEEKEHPNLDKY